MFANLAAALVLISALSLIRAIIKDRRRARIASQPHDCKPHDGFTEKFYCMTCGKELEPYGHSKLGPNGKWVWTMKWKPTQGDQK